jgi:hypothetical protein
LYSPPSQVLNRNKMFIRQEVYLQSAHADDLSPFVDARTQQRDVASADGV